MPFLFLIDAISNLKCAFKILWSIFWGSIQSIISDSVRKIKTWEGGVIRTEFKNKKTTEQVIFRLYIFWKWFWNFWKLASPFYIKFPTATQICQYNFPYEYFSVTYYFILESEEIFAIDSFVWYERVASFFRFLWKLLWARNLSDF